MRILELWDSGTLLEARIPRYEIKEIKQQDLYQAVKHYKQRCAESIISYEQPPVFYNSLIGLLPARSCPSYLVRNEFLCLRHLRDKLSREGRDRSLD